MEITEDASQKKRRVALYIRVSTQEQKIAGYSFEDQRKKLLAHVKENTALNLVTQEDWIYEDVHTGSEMNRTGLKKLLEDVEKGKYDAVLVWRIDRLSRSLKHLLDIFERLQKQKASFISLQENIDFNGAIGNLIFQIFGAIAQFERELIKSRTRTGILASAEMGNYTGTRIPFGYKSIKNRSGKGKKLVLISKEKEWVEKIFHWYIYEDMGYEQIAKKLQECNVPQSEFYKRKDASGWTKHHIENMIQNSLYRGEYAANTKSDEGNLLPEEQWTVVAIPPCISEMTFVLAQQQRKERKANRRSDYIYLLSGKMYDVSLAHHPKFSGKPRTKGGRSYRRKQFKKDGKHYPVFETPIEPVEEAVWQKVRLALKEPEVFINEYFNERKYGKSRLADINSELLSCREKKANLEIEQARIEKAYDKGTYSLEKMEDKVRELEEQIGSTGDEIDKIQQELSIASLKEKEIAGLRKAAEVVNYNLNNLERKQKKILIDLFVDRVEMDRTELPSEGKRSKWDIHAKVIFRFVPDKFTSPTKKGSTSKGLTKEDISDVFGKSEESGGRWRT
jgi:site-specific DNA recombinase